MTRGIVEGQDVSYADLESQGFSQSFINDYMGLKRSLTPLAGVEADPNGIYTANQSGWYIGTQAPVSLWFNASAGSNTGWFKLV